MYVTKLRAVREAAKLSQAELGQRIGVSEKTVRRWEGGESEPTFNNIRDMKRVLGVEQDSELGDVDERAREAEPGAPAVIGANAEWLGLYLEARGFLPGTDRRIAIEKRLAGAAGLDGITPGVVRTIVDLVVAADVKVAQDETTAARERGAAKGHSPLPPKKRGR